MLKKFFKDVNKKQAISWALYDFANSSYFLIIVSFIFSIYFKEIIAPSNGDFWWGFAVSISVFLGGITTPIIGAISDKYHKKKSKLILFSTIAMIGTALLYFSGPNLFVLSMLIFMATNFCVEVSQTLYDSFLNQVSTKETKGRISGLGYAFGYLGGIVSMLILKPVYESQALHNLTFPLTAMIFFLFALPSFIFIKEKPKKISKESFFQKLKHSFKSVFKTIKQVKKHKKIAWFLVAFYLMNDGLATLFAFVSIYAKNTLSFSISEIAIILLLIQAIAFPATIFFGWLSDKKGHKKILLATLFIWCFIVLATSLANSKIIFYIIAIFTGMVVGSGQSVARAWFIDIIPRNKLNQFFGFNGFANKIAALTGPLVFGTISVLTGSQRIAMASLLIYFIASLLIFYKIKE